MKWLARREQDHEREAAGTWRWALGFLRSTRNKARVERELAEHQREMNAEDFIRQAPEPWLN